MKFYETSAKEMINVNEVFKQLAQDLVESANNFEIPRNAYAGSIHINQPQNSGWYIWMGPNNWII